MSRNAMVADAGGQTNSLIAAALTSIDLSKCVTPRQVRTALDPLSEAIYQATKAGQMIVIEPIVEALSLPISRVEWAVSALERAAMDGEAAAAIAADARVISTPAVCAAAGALEWEKWRAQHPDDLSEHAVLWSISTVAHHIARRAECLIGCSLNPAEAAWAAVEGARRVGLPVCRSAWRYALEGSSRGEAERLDEEARA